MDGVNRNLSQIQSEILRRELKDIVVWASFHDLKLPKKILVTGASGFIGQWLLASLIAIAKNDHTVVVQCETQRYSDIKEIWFPNLERSLLRAKGESEYDLVFDLSLPPTGPSIREQINQAQNFYQNISRISKLVRENGRIVHPSSGAVYGEQRFSNKLCESLPLKRQGLSVYGEAKKGIEDLSNAFDANGIDFLTPRIFSVFGPLMREDSPLVGNIFIREAAKGNNLHASSSENIFRDFCFITDLVKQLIYIGVRGSLVKNINLGSRNVAEISQFGWVISSIAKVDFEPGGKSEKTDGYYGCLHELRKLSPFVAGSGNSLELAVEKSLSFYKVTK